MADTQRKKLGPLAWILIGCGGLIVLAGIAVVGGGIFLGKKVVDYAEEIEANPGGAAAAAAEMIVRLNPDLELVESDREAGRMRVRQVSTGKEMVFDYQDIREGRISFEGEDGESVSFDAATTSEGEGANLRISTPEGTQTFGATGDAVELPSWLDAFPGMNAMGGTARTAEGRRSGDLAFATESSAQQVIDFYRDRMEALGMEIQSSSTSAGSTEILSLTGTTDDHELAVTATTTPDGTRVSLRYDGPA